MTSHAGRFTYDHTDCDPADCEAARKMRVKRERGFDPLSGAEVVDDRSRPEIKKRPEVWTVTDPYAGTRHDFETSEQAMAHAASVSRSDRATVVTDPESVRVVVMRVDPRVTLQAVRNLTGPAVRPVQPPEPVELSLQALAGARLFYALYHDEDLVMWAGDQRARGGKAVAFNKAYVSAQNAFLPDGRRQGEPVRDANGLRHDGVSIVKVAPTDPADAAPAPDMAPVTARCVRCGRQLLKDGLWTWCECVPAGRDAVQVPTSPRPVVSAVQAPRLFYAPLPGETFPGPAEAYRKGRTDAADAIRQQARMYAEARGDEGGTLIDAEEAARLAEGSIGAQAATS